MAEAGGGGGVVVGACAAGWLGLSAVAAAWWSGLGFPDGHLTDLDRARAWTLPALAALGVTMAIVTARWGRGRPRAAAAALVVGVAVAWAADAALTAGLDHGGGG
jgi:hypothetical protein